MGGELRFDRLGQVSDVEAERAGLALEADHALAIDEIETVGPAGVGALRGVLGIV